MQKYGVLSDEPSIAIFSALEKVVSRCATCLGVLGALIVIFPPLSVADIAVVLYMLKKSYCVKLLSENEGSRIWSHFHNCIKNISRKHFASSASVRKSNSSSPS